MMTTVWSQKRTIVCTCLPVATLAFVGCNISPGGGGGSPPVEVVAAGIVTLQIPAGANVDPEQVVIRTTMANATDEAFWNTGSLYNVDNRASFEVRINTGSSPPNQPVDGEFIVPDEFIQDMSPQSHLNLFAQVLFENENEIHDTVEPLTPSITVVDGVASVMLPTDVFNMRASSESFEAVIIIGSWSEATTVTKSLVAAQSASSDCVPLTSPTHSKVTSDYGSRVRPFPEASNFHKGLDFRAPDGTDITSAADGKVVWVGTGSSASASLGINVIVEHQVVQADGSVRKDRTRYSHLKEPFVEVGDEVVAGETLLAASDCTGTCKADHLHFIYYKGGAGGALGTKIDPQPCFDAGCGDGQRFNPDTGLCEEPPCPPGTSFDSSTGECLTPEGCPADLPFLWSDGFCNSTPEPPRPDALLGVGKGGDGSGGVTSSPAGISCGTDCSETYDIGTVVTLTATPDPDSAFEGWSGACTGTGACVVTMDADKAVTATFTTGEAPPPPGGATITCENSIRIEIGPADSCECSDLIPIVDPDTGALLFEPTLSCAVGTPDELITIIPK